MYHVLLPWTVYSSSDYVCTVSPERSPKKRGPDITCFYLLPDTQVSSKWYHLYSEVLIIDLLTKPVCHCSIKNKYKDRAKPLGFVCYLPSPGCTNYRAGDCRHSLGSVPWGDQQREDSIKQGTMGGVCENEVSGTRNPVPCLLQIFQREEEEKGEREDSSVCQNTVTWRLGFKRLREGNLQALCAEICSHVFKSLLRWGAERPIDQGFVHNRIIQKHTNGCQSKVQCSLLKSQKKLCFQ